MSNDDITKSKKSRFNELQGKIDTLLASPEWTEQERKSLTEFIAERDQIDSELELREKARTSEANVAAKRNAAYDADRGDEEAMEYTGGMKTAVYNLIHTNTYKAAFDSYVRLRGNVHKMSAGNLKTIQEANDGDGGFLIPQDYFAQLIEKLPAPTNLVGRVRKIPSSRDAVVVPIQLSPDNIETSYMTMVNAGEVLPSSTTALSPNPQFAQLTIPVYTYTGNIPLSLNMFEDPAIDIGAMVARAFGNYASLIKENMIVTGSGNNQPIGLATLAAGAIGSLSQITNVTISAGGGATAVADGLIKLGYAVPPQYGEDGVYVLSKTNSGSYIATIKTTTNAYLLTQGMTDQNLGARRSREINGNEIVWDSFMANLTTTDGGSTLKTSGIPFLFGSPDAYVAVERIGFSVRMLDQIGATQNTATAFARFRYGGAPAEPWRWAAGVMSA